MSLIRLKAKVLLKSEESMEQEELYDLGNIARSSHWVWRDTAYPFEEVYRIVSYSATKTMVQMYDEEKILVNESFEEVFTKWSELRQQFPEYIGSRKEGTIEEENDENDGDV